jgi:hypothetical protein
MQVVYEKFCTLHEISVSFLWIGENLALRNFFNMESCSTMSANAHTNHLNPRHLKKNNTLSLLEAKIYTPHGNFAENSHISKNFQVRNFLQVDPGCTEPTNDPSNQSF